MRLSRPGLWRLVELIVTCTCLPLASRAEPEPDFPDRVQIRAASGLTVTCSAGDEAYAQALVQLLEREPLGYQAEDSRAALTLADLRTRRDQFLAALAQYLSLQQLPPKTAGAYDNFLRLFETVQAELAKPPRRFALWRRPELIGRLQAGEPVPGFSLEGPDEVRLNLKFDVNGADDEAWDVATARIAEAWASFEVPLAIGEEPGVTPEDDVAAGLQHAKGWLPEVGGVLAGQLGGPFVVLHEAVETTIVVQFISSADRRWFCDGVANYLAWRILADAIGEEAALGHYHLERSLRRHAALAPRIDLERWPAAENIARENYPADLNTASYAYATKVIATICARHGDALLPRLFREIGRTPRAETTMATVYRAYHELTGEDLGQELTAVRDLVLNLD